MTTELPGSVLPIPDQTAGNSADVIYVGGFGTSCTSDGSVSPLPS